jgi:histidinol phosphatase-like enzyme (inositol monophosphatase family)
MSLVDFSRFIDELATLSGQAILPFFRSSLAPDNKARGGDFDPVTEADRAAEVMIRQRIRQNFPAHGIVGEEFGDDQPQAEYVWFIDPIDGTGAFVAGLNSWGTLIGLTRQGMPCYGLMHQPFTQERFFGDGAAAFYRGLMGEKRIATRRCTALKDVVLSTTSPHLFEPDEHEAFMRVRQNVRMIRYGADCYAYCLLAAGHIDLVIEAGLKPHDIVPLIPIIEGAGGIVTDWQGGSASKGGAVIAAGDRHIHQAAMKLLRG